MYAFLLTAVFMFVLDLAWLLTNSTYHNNLIKNIQGSNPKLRPVPAALIYVLIPTAVYFLAVLPSKTIKSAALKGALLGLAIYGVYDLTNYATFTNYTLEMTVSDMAWGTFLCSIGAVFGYAVLNKKINLIN